MLYHTLEHITRIEEKYLTHQVMQSSLLDPSNGATALKHLKQQVSHIRKC